MTTHEMAAPDVKIEAARTEAKTHPNPPRHDAPPEHPGVRGPDWWLMMKAFLTQGRKIASCAPSSGSMARKMIDGIDWDRAKCIVELGAGTGPITAQLVQRLRPHTQALVIELDPMLCARLKARFSGVPNLHVVQGDATKFDQYLAERNLPQVDHVLSGLPLPSFPEQLRNAVLETSARALGPTGTFRQLTVMPLVYYKLYARYFDNVKFQFVPWNLPPGGVYLCRGFRPDSVTPPTK
ncbi:sam-dependent methyltransferase : Ribosomal RNA adenine methylase transferase OS=Isosphaera pallida (strain ATCC 43644 / DSM 9630 / IS1B) GN=Isop_2139 PE=4 SV=1: RrnaAD [Gemmataceae bacterium]|nr:sam-dependent methyltransferase : Ribosomal RNA adenine methylase transferase OS=Isosphaera pallida (strain ATCC 43644 / DSM 9630 / IS1B) GN=Isop_2139 PE=4 SV=1: RrnaAD [Gemmataceae bacterium]VTT97057.1 sam-dependent methyltransferase : Ribosomal RNA adenine methylase transferase OS=Isosphaera pallida (strain ATCC 43644 / DSM 9630 / IS1B) GN=Isop_2139 PE=4 SV=1: RrnaAD [Gemmataceae bacterium]